MQSLSRRCGRVRQAPAGPFIGQFVTDKTDLQMPCCGLRCIRNFFRLKSLASRLMRLTMPLAQALHKEAIFFRDHPSYRGLDKRVGTSNLSKTLNQVSMCLWPSTLGYRLLQCLWCACSSTPRSVQQERLLSGLRQHLPKLFSPALWDITRDCSSLNKQVQIEVFCLTVCRSLVSLMR